MDERLTALRDSMVSARDLAEPWDLFFDLTDDPAFMALGRPARHPPLEAAVEAVAERLFGREVLATGLLLIEIPERSFFHGRCFLEGRLASILFFEDVPVGLLALPESLRGGQMTFARFSGLDLSPGSPFSPDPPATALN